MLDFFLIADDVDEDPEDPGDLPFVGGLTLRDHYLLGPFWQVLEIRDLEIPFFLDSRLRAAEAQLALSLLDSGGEGAWSAHRNEFNPLAQMRHILRSAVGAREGLISFCD
ncbi:MAG: hypothetical protein AAGM22_08085 [Acidobacteriota bacterium]